MSDRRMLIRTLGVMGAAAALLLAACGNDDTTTVAGGPTPLPIGGSSGPGQTAMAAEDSAATATTVMWWSPVEFVAGGGLDALGGSRPAYRIRRNDNQLTELADRLGTEVEDYSDPSSRDAPVSDRPPDVDITPTLSTGDGVSWNYWSPEGEAGLAVATCDRDGNCTDNSSVAPENTSEDEAVAVARDLLDGIGPGLDDAKITAAAGWGVWNVTVEYQVAEDMVSGLVATVAVGEGSEIFSASGFAGEIEPLGDYPTVGAADAIDRMNDGWFNPVGPPMAAPMPHIAVDTPVVATEPAPPTTVPQSTTTMTAPPGQAPDVGQTEPGDPGTVEPDAGVGSPERPSTTTITLPPGGELSPDAQPEPYPMPPEEFEPPEPETVTLTDVEWSLTMFHAWDGSGVYVVPAYTFAGDDGISYSVLAVTDDMLQPPESPDDGVLPLPADVGASSGSSSGGGTSGSPGTADGREPATDMETTTSVP